ncbi:cation diffusion facilitator family transporter [Ruminococcus sp. Marseille-P6503]|uniref:cation diffusion facilitator family transporter n=1 Tax=Ruminococcus sp. Marseille-P6503 TaxID=2364796 RepID=UPI000F5417C8|nr:cation diffusion facilitator family transporter [Ruminococcus sp. Marseille-P6503]
MIKLIVKRFIKDSENVSDKKVRERYGILGGALGIICNTFLFALKLCAGTVMNSIAIISDAFNNMSDMGSSLVTIIGTKLSGKRPDREHPFGHGRLEYISSLIVSFIILLMGFELLKSSAVKIFEPEELNFSLPITVLLSLSVLVKVWLYFSGRYMGEKINSSTLKATARDSLNDVIATSAVILTTVIGQFIKFPPLDGIVGTVVALLIMKTGFDIARDTVGILLGTPASRELVNEISSRVLNGEGITGVHDLIVHDYGPGRVMASIHAEVPDDSDIVAVHEVIDAVEKRIEAEMGIHMVIHMDPVSVNCERSDKIKGQVVQAVADTNSEYSIHDFRIVDGENQINLIFDMVVPYGISDAQLERNIQKIKQKLSQADERYNCVIQIDNEY